MSTLSIEMNAAQEAGLNAVTAEHNATALASFVASEEVPTYVPVSAAQYAQNVFGSALNSYATKVLSVPSFKFVQRFTTNEYAAVMAAASGSAELQAYVDKLSASPTVNLTNEDVISGLSMLEAVGLLAPGRAAQILAP